MSDMGFKPEELNRLKQIGLLTYGLLGASLLIVEWKTLSETWIGDYLCQNLNSRNFYSDQGPYVAASALLGISAFFLRRSLLLYIPAFLLFMQVVTAFSGNWHDCDRKGCESCAISRFLLLATLVITLSLLLLRWIAILIARYRTRGAQ